MPCAYGYPKLRHLKEEKLSRKRHVMTVGIRESHACPGPPSRSRLRDPSGSTFAWLLHYNERIYADEKNSNRA